MFQVCESKTFCPAKVLERFISLAYKRDDAIGALEMSLCHGKPVAETVYMLVQDYGNPALYVEFVDDVMHIGADMFIWE